LVGRNPFPKLIVLQDTTFRNDPERQAEDNEQKRIARLNPLLSAPS